MNEHDVLKALRALAESDRGLEAPAEIEDRVRAAFRTKHSAGQDRAKWWAWAAVAAGVVLAGVVAYEWRPTVQPVRVAAVAPPAAVQIERPAVVEAPVQSAVQMVAPPKRRARRTQPTEVVTEFFPLLDIVPPFERGELVRVSLPASAMQMVGLPVHEDRLEERVQADVLVGEEGTARAIRFVSYQK